MKLSRLFLPTIILSLTASLLIACGGEDKTAAEPKEEVKVVEEKTKPIEWRLATTWGPTLPVFSDAAKILAKSVAEMSDGRLVISVDASNKHKSALGIFDFVQTGQYQIGHTASYYWKGKDINTLFFTTMPFGMIASEQYAWYYYGGGKDLSKKVYDQYGIINYPGGNTGNQMGGWFRKEINSIDDFQGLKMRIPGFAGEVLAKIGAKPTNIPPGELYTALERNTIDALEWVGPALDLSMGFHKIAPFYYTGWHEPAAELQFIVNKEAFESLPADLQAILETALEKSAFQVTIKHYHEHAENWAKIATEYPDIKIKTFPDEVMNQLKQANADLIAEFEAKGGLTAEIIQSQRNYLEKTRTWTNISDRAYLDSL